MFYYKILFFLYTENSKKVPAEKILSVNFLPEAFVGTMETKDKLLLKQYGITEKQINSMSLFLFRNDMEKENVIDAFNKWLSFSRIRFDDAETTALAIEHFRKLKEVTKEELKIALDADRLLEEDDYYVA